MALAQVAFPLRHKRPFGAAATFLTFLIAFVEFAAVLYVSSSYFGISITPAELVNVVLPCAYLVAGAAAAAMFVVTRRRSAEVTKDLELERPQDLEGRRMEVVRELKKFKAEERRHY